MARARRSIDKGRPIGVLFSGGLDSCALVAHYLEQSREVWPVFVRFGLPWEETEILWAHRFIEEIQTDRLRPISFATLNLEEAYRGNWSLSGRTPDADSNDSEVFLPARNLLLTTKALLALSKNNVFDLAIGTLKGNPFPDGRRSYFQLLEHVFSGGFARPVNIEAPFRKLTKAGVISGLKGYPLHLSLSCINPVMQWHCGHCNKCSERQKAFREAGVRDLTMYESPLPATLPSSVDKR